MVRKIVTLVAITATLVLAACNTVRGVGQDLESAADEVDEET
jgi:entericidin B